MGAQVHYELYIRKSPTSAWTLDLATEDRAKALATAEEMLADRRAAGVKVQKESLDEETREFRSVTILTKGAVQAEKAKVIIEAAELDESCITHSTRHQERLVMLGPVSLKVRNTLMLCDKYLDRIALMYTMGEIDQQAHNDAQYDVKTKLEALGTSLRNH